MHEMGPEGEQGVTHVRTLAGGAQTSRIRRNANMELEERILETHDFKNLNDRCSGVNLRRLSTGRAVHENRRSRLPDIFRRPEGNGGVDVLGGTFDPTPLGAIKGKLLTVHGEKILPQELSQIAENVAHMPDQGIISQNGVPALQPVQQENRNRNQDAAEKREHKYRR